MALKSVGGVLICWLCTALTGFGATWNDTFNMIDESCAQNFTLAATDPPRPLLPDLLQPANRTGLAFAVRACSDAELLLYTLEHRPQPRAGVVHVVLGRDNQSASVIEDYTAGHDDRRPENPLHCRQFRRFRVAWSQDRVEVFRRWEENGTWGKFLVYPSTLPMELQVQSVFLAYKLNTGDNSTSDWTLYGSCPPVSDDESSMVTRAHLAGAVITALLVGILFGAVCVLYLPKLLSYLRQSSLPCTGSKAEDAHTEEEMSTLMGVQSPHKPPDPARPPPPAAATTGPDAKVDLALPGDNPPPPPAPTPHPAPAPRKASNTYTPYHQMGGGNAATTTKTDDVSTTSADVTQATPSRKPSSGGRVGSPLPALPGDGGDGDDAGAAEVTSGPDDVYVNADTHIYEGMRHEAPIYENRNTGHYEALQPSAKEKK